MKRIILNFEEKATDFKELVQEAFNKDILSFLVSKETYTEFENIDRVTLYSKDRKVPAKFLVLIDKVELEKEISEHQIPKANFGFYLELKTKEDERAIIDLSKTGQLDFIIVSAKDWKIIPFENLIAEMHKNDTSLIADVETIKDAELMLKTMEIGVDGILMTPQNVNNIIDLKNLIHVGFKLEMNKAKVLSIRNIPESERVCVDTTSLLKAGEGMLVGSTAMGFALIHAEVFETQFVSSRPFRVNAGDVSAYILVPGEEPDTYRTNYLSELKGGDKVLVIDTKGNTRIVTVGRVKIETRPMLRFELEASKGEKKIPINCVCQNAETIRLVDAEGNPQSVVNVKVGDEILVHLGPGATHFGTAIKETIIEK